MNRHVVAACLIGLTLAGCSLDRSAEKRVNPSMPPVGLTPPMPSIHEAIRQDNNGPEDDPASRTAANGERQWPHSTDLAAVRTDAPTGPPVAAEAASDTEASAGASLAGRPAAAPGPSGAWASPQSPEGTASRPSEAADGPAPSVATTDPGLPDPVEATGDLEAVPIRRRAPMPDSGPLADAALPNPAPAPAQETMADPVGPTSPVVGGPDAPAPAEPALAADPAAGTETTSPAGPASRAGAQGLPPGWAEEKPSPSPAPAPVSRSADPLLGANPEIMPPLDGAPEVAVRDTPAAPSGPSAPPTPADPVALPPEEPGPPVVGLQSASPGPAAEAETVVPPAGVQTAGPPTQATRGALPPDPLLGPNPDIMPRFDLPVPEASKAPKTAAEAGSGREQPPAQPDPAPMTLPDSAAPTVATPPITADPVAADTSDAAIPAAQPAAAAPATPPVSDAEIAAAAPADTPTPAPKPAPKPTAAPAAPPTAPGAPSPPKTDRKARSAGAEAEGPRPIDLPPLSGPQASRPPDASGPRSARPRIVRVSYQPPSRDGQSAPAVQVDIPPARPSVATADAPPPGVVVLPDGFMARPARDDAVVPASTSAPRVEVAPPGPQIQPPPAAAPTVDPMAIRAGVPDRSVFEEGRVAARVGNDYISLHELKKAISLRRKAMNTGPLSAADRYQLAKTVLDDLVDRLIVTQEARREIKDPKKFDMFMSQADVMWNQEELPPLLRQTASANIHELRQKLTEREESLAEIQDAYRKEFLFRGFLEFKIGPKLRVDLPEMHHYYQEHIREFDRPATVTWREVVVEVGKHPDRLTARRKADGLLARLRRGEEIAALAAAESDGPNRAAGGLWQTSPGSYAVPAVNAALDSHPAGQISPVLEGPTSFHIIRVEGRRAAGPATFAEVQDEIKKAVRYAKVQRESIGYLEKLRKNTVVSTVFDDPAVRRTSGEGPGPAGR